VCTLVFVPRYWDPGSAARQPGAPGADHADVCGDFEAGLAEFNGDTGHVHLPVNFLKAGRVVLANSLKGIVPTDAARVQGPVAA